MADIQSNIKVNIDTTEALASIKNLQRQISAFHTSMARGGAAANAVTAQMQQNLINSINATGKFSAQMKTIRTTTESFTNSLEKNKFSMGEYFRYAGGASKTFGRLFKTEFDTINKVARENVKDLQTQYIKMGRDASGAMKAIAVRPLSLDMSNLATKTMIASEKQAILNQLLKQGSTNLLNFGKNTQWAGRQLMVGFTIPLITVGSTAAKTFMTMEAQAIRFKKVYGDIFTPVSESTAALESIKNLGKEFTKYGVAVSATVGLAADAAAAGFQGVDLQNQTTAATRLAILGQIDNQKALETTISLQNAFGTSSSELADTINFLNSVENQTVLSLDDITTAIPKTAPIVKQLGGNVKDLAFFLTAMKQGGINASEGANALKSGLASMINPTGKAAAMLESFGINIKKIVVDNKGDLKKTVIEFATALNQLDPLNRAQAIEQMFGKFQFARISTLMQNVTAQGTQASKVLDLAGASVQDLANLSEKELGITADSSMNKFKASVENLKLSLLPLGEEFLKAATPIIKFVTKILDKFNNLGDGTKKIIVTLTAIFAGLGPVLLMTFGLLANGVANLIKGFVAIKSIFNQTGQSSATLGTEVKYMTLEQRNAAAVAASLDQVHKTLAQTFTAEAGSVNLLTAAYQRSMAAQRAFIPTGVLMGRGPVKPKGKFAHGGIIAGPGGPTSDSVPIMASNGEAIISASIVNKYPGMIKNLIAGNIPGFKKPGIIKSHTGRVSGGRINTGTHSSAGIIAPGNLATKAKGSTISGMSSSFIGGPEGATLEFQAAASAALKTQMMTLDGVTRLTDKAATNYEANWTGINNHLDEISNIFAKGLTPDITDVSQLGQKQFPAMIKYIDELEKSLQISATQANTLRESTRKLFNPDLGTATAPGKDAVTKNRQRIETGINAQGEEVVTGVKTERVSLPGKSSGDYLDKKTKRLTAREYAKRGLTPPTEKTTFAHIKSGEKVSDYIAPTTSKAPTPAEQKILNALSSGKKISEGTVVSSRKPSPTLGLGRTRMINSLVAADEQGKKDAKGYNDGVASGSSPKNDPALRNRSKQRSAHPQVIKDGTDDGKAYSTAVQKSIDRQNKKLTKQGKPPIGASQSGSRNRRKATRLQGPAPIGPSTPKGTSLLPMTTALTGAEARKQKLGSMPKKVNRLGGGMGLIGANMALSTMPNFVGKEVIQGTMTGASMGMLFGPWGAAAGAAIGGVTSILSKLIAKEKEHEAVVKSSFTTSAKDLQFFGGKVVDATLKINNMPKGIDKISGAFGNLAPQIQAFVDHVNKLPKDDPTKVFVESIKNLVTTSSIADKIKAKVSSAVASGQLDPKNAKEYAAGLLAAADKAGQFNLVWKSIKSSVTDASTATTSSLNQLNNEITKTGASFGNIPSDYKKASVGSSRVIGSIVANQSKFNISLMKSYKNLNAQQKTLADTTLNLFAVTSNGSLTYDELKTKLDAIKKSSVNGANGVTALGLAIKNSGDKDALIRYQQIVDLYKNAGKEADLSLDKILLLNSAANAGVDVFVDYTPGLSAEQKLSSALEKARDIKSNVDKLKSAMTSTYVDPENADGTKKLSAAATAYLKILDAEIKALEKKRDAQKAINDENDRLKQFQMQQQAMKNDITQAKISGNYLQAALLQQQMKNDQAKYNAETESKKKDEEIARLKARYDAIAGGATLTKKEGAKKANGGLIKKYASGGLIMGPGTGRSDSIKANLGYAGGGSINVSNGEYIVKASSVGQYGIPKMNSINNGTANVDTNSGSTVYNINMPITSNESNPEAVANYVIKKLQLTIDKNNKSNKVF